MNLKETLAIQFTYTHEVLKMNSDGMTSEESLIQPEPGGNCLNWIVGHIVATRNHLLRMVNREPVWTEDEIKRYDRGSAPVTGADDAQPLEKLLADFSTTQGTILEGIAAIPDTALTSPAPFSPSNNSDETVASLLAGLAFHEAYHVGQTGVLRRIAGKDGSIA